MITRVVFSALFRYKISDFHVEKINIGRFFESLSDFGVHRQPILTIQNRKYLFYRAAIKITKEGNG